MDWCFALEPDAPELQVGMDLFRFGLISGHERMSGVGSLEDAGIDIGDTVALNVYWRYRGNALDGYILAGAVVRQYVHCGTPIDRYCCMRSNSG